MHRRFVVGWVRGNRKTNLTKNKCFPLILHMAAGQCAVGHSFHPTPHLLHAILTKFSITLYCYHFFPSSSTIFMSSCILFTTHTGTSVSLYDSQNMSYLVYFKYSCKASSISAGTGYGQFALCSTQRSFRSVLELSLSTIIMRCV